MIDTKKAREMHRQYYSGKGLNHDEGHAFRATILGMADEIDRLRAALRECRDVLMNNDGTSFCDEDVVSAIAAADALLGDSNE